MMCAPRRAVKATALLLLVGLLGSIILIAYMGRIVCNRRAGDSVYTWTAASIAHGCSHWQLRQDASATECRIRSGPLLLQQSTDRAVLVWETTAGCWSDDAATGGRFLVTAQRQWMDGNATTRRQQVTVKLGSVRPLPALDNRVVFKVAVDLSLATAQSLTLTLSHNFAAGEFVDAAAVSVGCVPSRLSNDSVVGSCAPLRFGVLGDNQYRAVTFRQIASRLRHLYRPTHILHVGDAVQNGDRRDEWQTDFFDVVRDTRLAHGSMWLYASGNHDADSSRHLDSIPLIQWPARSSLSMPRSRTTTLTLNSDHSGNEMLMHVTRRGWRALRIGPLFVIMLDANVDSSEQDDFLIQALQQPDRLSAAFTIVVTHIPPFMEFWEPRTWFDGGESEWGAFVRKRYVPLFEQHGVDLVISGHQHNYARGERNGVVYVVVGGAGGLLESDRVQRWPGDMFTVVHNQHHFAVMDVYSNDDSVGPRLYWHAYNLRDQRIDDFVLLRRNRSILASVFV